jgi:anaerobic ribonucleoside-triphosphate reductase
MEQKTNEDIFVFENATSNRTIKNIANSLKNSLQTKYFKGDKDTINKMSYIHGFHPDFFDSVGMMSKIINGRLNDISIDANANKSEKTISALSAETSAAKDKATGFDYLYQEMKSIYGRDEAKRLSGEMYDMSLGISDSTKLLNCYCYAFDFSRLIIEGRPFGQLPSLPCNSIRSYIGSMTETVHQLSQHLAGACGISTLFFDIAHLCLYKHKLDIRELKTNKWFRKEIENTFQHFVHSMNMLSRDAAQSPFSNISINDSIKLKKIVLELSHMFPLEELPISEPTGLFTDEEKNEFYLNYVVDYIGEIQNIFLDFFDKGAPTLGGAPYRFPISTLALSKHRDKKTCGWKVSDASFLKNVCKREIYRYNIFSSEGTKFASCCFAGKQKLWVKERGEKILTPFDEIYNKTRTTEESIIKHEDGVTIEVYHNNKEVKAKVIALDYDDVMYEIVLENGVTMEVTKDHLHPLWFNEDFIIDVKSEHLFNGNEILLTNNRHVKIKEIKMKWFTGKVYCLKVDTEEKYFDIDNDIVTHNCRLINDLELMDDYASQANSFGAGGSIGIGSHRIVTIDYPRLVLETETERDFFKLLNQRLEDSAKILKAHKMLIQRLADAGLQMFITSGWIRMDRMFSTFGLIGMHECEEMFKEKFGNDRDILGIILQFVNSKVKEFSKKYGLAGNIEQIPGESMAIRMCESDKIIFGEERVPYVMYSNQHLPLWNEADIWERLLIDGKYNGYISGGGIAHATIGEKVTGKQAEKIIMFAIECGCEHFALNSFYSECEKGHVHFGKHDTCQICGSKVVDWMVRIVGFFVRVSDMNKIRREWEIPRRTLTSLKDKTRN